MQVLAWILIGLFSFGTVVTVTQVGKPREPITPGSAVVSTLINLALIIALVILGTGV